jgi:hypothetical protein
MMGRSFFGGGQELTAACRTYTLHVEYFEDPGETCPAGKVTVLTASQIPTPQRLVVSDPLRWSCP